MAGENAVWLVISVTTGHMAGEQKKKRFIIYLFVCLLFIYLYGVFYKNQIAFYTYS